LRADQKELSMSVHALSPGTPAASIETFVPEELGRVHRLHRLAERHREVGEEHEAEPLLQQVLEIQERTLGPAHPQVALTLSSLMFLYRQQGRETEAEAAATRAQSILVTHARQTMLTSEACR
jgi:hypothetical protein